MNTPRRLTREVLTPLRNATNSFLIVYLWNHHVDDEINQPAALLAVRQLRDELNNVVEYLRGGEAR